MTISECHVKHYGGRGKSKKSKFTYKRSTIGCFEIVTVRNDTDCIQLQDE